MGQQTNLQTIFLKPVGNVKPLANNRRQVPNNMSFKQLSSDLKSELGIEPNNSLMLYINSSFAPSWSDTIEQVAKHFSIKKEGYLNIAYSLTPAWG
jgi:ubiquitin-like protein ATG12